MSVRIGAPDLDRVRRSSPLVEILRWPAHAGRRAGLVAGGHPVLWVLDVGELPPEIGPLEDWVRTTDSERDVHARLQRLATLGPGSVTMAPGSARVEDGILRFAGHRIGIPPAEARLLTRLAETPDRVVGQDELIEMLELLGDGRPVDPSALAARIRSLRKRVRPAGLEIHVIGGHGFLLAAAPIQINASTEVRQPARRTPWSNSSPPS